MTDQSVLLETEVAVRIDVFRVQFKKFQENPSEENAAELSRQGSSLVPLLAEVNRQRAAQGKKPIIPPAALDILQSLFIVLEPGKPLDGMELTVVDSIFAARKSLDAGADLDPTYCSEINYSVLQRGSSVSGPDGKNRPSRSFQARRPTDSGSFDHWHQGLDFEMLSGTSIYPANFGDGIVVKVIPNKAAGTGRTVYVLGLDANGEAFLGVYMHCDTVLVKTGDIVTRDTPIATVGKDLFYHLHFEVARKMIIGKTLGDAGMKDLYFQLLARERDIPRNVHQANCENPLPLLNSGVISPPLTQEDLVKSRPKKAAPVAVH